jgi:hypothetical protein
VPWLFSGVSHSDEVCHYIRLLLYTFVEVHTGVCGKYNTLATAVVGPETNVLQLYYFVCDSSG